MNYRPDMGEKTYTFDDVQGVEEAKDEVQEVVEFLKNPEKFQRLGARLPTGGCGVVGGWGHWRGKMSLSQGFIQDFWLGGLFVHQQSPHEPHY